MSLDLMYKIKLKPRLVEFTLLQLLQHNVQLGASINFSLLSSHWFIFGVRQTFAVINLSQTVSNYRYFVDVIRLVISGRRRMLFVNERRYTKSVVADVALSVGESYVAGRWVGGSITNFKKIWFMYHRLLKHRSDQSLSRFQFNLKSSLRGLSLLRTLPAVVFFNSVKHSYWGTGETYALHIPSAGITDSDALPESVMYPIPGNDDAFGSVYFLNKLLAKVVLITKMKTLLSSYSKFSESLVLLELRFLRKKLRKALRIVKLTKNRKRAWLSRQKKYNSFRR